MLRYKYGRVASPRFRKLLRQGNQPAKRSTNGRTWDLIRKLDFQKLYYKQQLGGGQSCEQLYDSQLLQEMTPHVRLLVGHICVHILHLRWIHLFSYDPVERSSSYSWFSFSPHLPSWTNTGHLFSRMISIYQFTIKLFRGHSTSTCYLFLIVRPYVCLFNSILYSTSLCTFVGWSVGR